MDIIEQLKKLKEKGQMIVTEDFVISYNPFKDTFILDVGLGKKEIFFKIEEQDIFDEPFCWDLEGMYPYEVKCDGKSYEEVWEELEPYSKGASISMLPTFTDKGKEYTWVETDEGTYAIETSHIHIIKKGSD